MSSVHKGPVLRNPRELWEAEEEARRKTRTGESQLQALSSLVDHQKRHAAKIEALSDGLVEMAQTVQQLEQTLSGLKSDMEAIAQMVRRPSKKELDVPKDAT